MASKLQDALLAIREDYGRLTPKVVVEAARDPRNPLHNKFEWDDSVAGQKYREAQAQELIRSVRISYFPAGDKAPNSIRAFHAVYRQDQGHVYEPAEDIIDDPLARQMLLRDMQRDWLLMKQRWESFVEFWEVIRADMADTGT